MHVLMMYYHSTPFCFCWHRVGTVTLEMWCNRCLHVYLWSVVLDQVVVHITQCCLQFKFVLRYIAMAVVIQTTLLLQEVYPVWVTWNWPSQMAKFMRPTCGPPGACRFQVGPMLAPWTLLSGLKCRSPIFIYIYHVYPNTLSYPCLAIALASWIVTRHFMCP